MKNIITSLLFALTFILLLSCGGKKVEVAEPALPVFEFTANDTLAVMALANDYLCAINASDFEKAASLLHTVHGDSILPLNEDESNSYLATMRSLPQFGFELKELELLSNRDNKLRIAMKLTENADTNSGEGAINLYLNPVMQNGQWYLTALDKYADGVGLYRQQQ